MVRMLLFRCSHKGLSSMAHEQEEWVSVRFLVEDRNKPQRSQGTLEAVGGGRGGGEKGSCSSLRAHKQLPGSLAQRFSAWACVLPGHVWQHPGTFLVVQLGEGGSAGVLASVGRDQGCHYKSHNAQDEQPPQQRTRQPLVAMVPRLRDPGLARGIRATSTRSSR